MAGLGLQGAFGAVGGQRALDKVLEDRILAQKLAREQQRQLGADDRAERGLGLQERGVGLAEKRFGLEQSTAEQEAAAEAAEQEARKLYLGSLPAHLQPVAQAKQFGINIPLEDFEDPAVVRAREAEDAATQRESEFSDFTRREGFRENLLRTRPDKGADAGGVSPFQAERQARTLQSVDELLGKVSRWTVGAGSLLSALPETDARNFSAEVETLKSAIIQGELTAMREASKTGGALGQVSDREAKFLAASLGALDIGQSPANFKSQLGKIKQSIERWQATQAGLATPGRTEGPGGGGTVSMRAPDGRLLNVPADKVAELEAAGATRQ